MKKMIAFIGLFFLLLGGCQMNQDVRPKDIDPEDLPDVPAFQDEATREFLVSTEEVESGFYLMESKLEGFQMLFPENGIYTKLTSSTSDGKIETFNFKDINNGKDVHIIGQVKYHRDQEYLANPDEMLLAISGRNNFEDEFKMKETLSKEIYYGEGSKKIEHDGDETEVYSYIGYIKSRDKEYLGIDYNFYILCFNKDEICSKRVSEKKDQVEKIIDSITFINQEEVDRDD
ncbi:hypothetical protein [Amphibacillus cookii]|uniref:hypothetical protein n=1 Tax=Amphibacillus cookii TaxID=767787 RepID=UPI001957C537|nr:hypothetical protein [Amphibacillus cookii]MBM7540490.1 hypothetical protein [Amphibacillus cookii]